MCLPMSQSWLEVLISYLFDNSQSNRREIITHCGFDCIYLVINDVELVGLEVALGESMSEW